jgi:RNA polymerase sigma-70 factor, ECF subfamily
VGVIAAQFAEAGIGGGLIEALSDVDRRIEEGRLVRQAQAGDLSAFERLYRENVRKVFALCMRMSSDATLAEELTQDVFVRAWQKLGSFRGDSAFSSWLYPLTVNVALTERRSRRRRTSRFFSTDDLTPFDRPPAERPIAGPEAGLDLDKALASLPPGARAVFVLHDVEGYKHEEIAGLLDMAVGTSKAQLHRARKLLREALAS